MDIDMFTSLALPPEPRTLNPQYLPHPSNISATFFAIVASSSRA
jgi:hypothetical protein